MFVMHLRGQIWQQVRRAWIGIARAGTFAGLAGIAVGEIGGEAFNGGQITLFVHLASLGLGLLAAYGAVMTVGLLHAARGAASVARDIERGVRQSVSSGWQVVDSDEHKIPGG